MRKGFDFWVFLSLPKQIRGEVVMMVVMKWLEDQQKSSLNPRLIDDNYNDNGDDYDDDDEVTGEPTKLSSKSSSNCSSAQTTTRRTIHLPGRHHCHSYHLYLSIST